MITLLWEDDSGAAVTMQFDIDRQETHEFITTITEHPVEVGADVADHVRDELDRFTLEGYVTDCPTNIDTLRDDVNGRPSQGAITSVELQIPDKPLLIGVSSLIGAGISALGGLITGSNAPKANILTFDDFKSRVRLVSDLLDGVRRSHKPIRIISKIKEYDNMFLDQLTITRAPDDGTGATFLLSLREVRTVESDITVAPSPAEALGQSQKAAGSKSAEDDNELVNGKKKSVAKQIAERTGKYLDENNGVVGAVLDGLGF